jgi:hypothetical protein
VDSDPANGRPNHIRSAPEAHEFYIRDVMLDWANDDPNELSIERLGGPPSTPALTEDEQAELTASFMLRYANFTLTLINAMTRRPANEFSLAYSADKGGALRKQVYIGGHFRLDEDESLVIDVSDGGARYFVVPISNIWGTTLDIVGCTTGSIHAIWARGSSRCAWPSFPWADRTRISRRRARSYPSPNCATPCRPRRSG